MQSKTFQKIFIVFITFIIILTLGFGVIAFYYIANSYEFNKKDDKFILDFGKQKMTYYEGGMSSSISHTDPNKFEGDSISKIYFDAQYTPEGKIWLINLQYDYESFQIWGKNGNPSLGVILEASTWVENGQNLQRMFEEELKSSNRYSSVREGSLYGLDRYVEYPKSAYLYEHLVTMNAEGKPLRYLKVTTPNHLIGTGKGGLVEHYFMYNDFMQVRVSYTKQQLHNWQAIENAMIAYIDQLYKDAEQ